MIQTATAGLVCSALAAGVVFVVRYLRTTWFRSPMGWHAMTFMLVAVILLSLGVSKELFGADWPGRAWVRLVAYTLINVVLWWRVVLLFTGQRRRRPGAMMSEPETPEDR